MQDNDDNPTVVIDFNALKEELKKKEELASDDDLGIEFQVSTEDNSDLENLISEEEEEEIQSDLPNKNVYFFEFQSDFFSNLSYAHGHDYLKTVTQLPDLNKVLQTDPESIIVFYYNAAPKAVNQLCAQIKKKFVKTRSIIIAKNLSAQKAQAHKETASGADGYLTDQSTESDFNQLIREL